MMGAYDVGLDYSDGIGRFSKLNLSTVYSKDDFSALLEV
jgi:hypothetical protein